MVYTYGLKGVLIRESLPVDGILEKSGTNPRKLGTFSKCTVKISSQ